MQPRPGAVAAVLALYAAGCDARHHAADASRASVEDAAEAEAESAADAATGSDARASSARDAAEVAPLEAGPVGAEAGPVFDAGEAGAGGSEAGPPADAAGPCPDAVCGVGQACAADRPCSAPDTLCVAGACVPDPEAPPAAWRRSAWSGRVGLVRRDDSTLWCAPTIVAAGADPSGVTMANFQPVALDSSVVELEGLAEVTLRVRVQCFATAALSGDSSLLTSAWSRDAEQDVVRIQCPPERPHAGFPRCQVATSAAPAWVYAGSSCGDGLAGLAAKASLRGQLLGDRYELGTPGRPLFNRTASVGVVGTDLGFQFLAQGRMYMGFGDTWDNEASLLGPAGYRGSVLASTLDFEPADENGIALQAWETAADRPGIAREVVPSPHDQSGATEFTAIAAAGFGLSEGAARYRFLWFASIKTWSPFVTNESTFAWSESGTPFVRGDQAPALHPPRWPFDSYFGPGAIWVDREHGYVYFLGVRTYTPSSPVRLARVRATLTAVRDHLQYEYWTGAGWRRPDPSDEYALARLADPAADLIPGSAGQNTRPELSVSYNPYVGRFLLLVHNDATPFFNEPATNLQIWQAPAIEGPWTLADTGDALVLQPNLYGPYHSEQTYSGDASEIHFLMSDWNLLPFTLGQPYTVGQWGMKLERRLRAGCMP